MRNYLLFLWFALLVITGNAAAVPKPHVVGFGKLTVVKWFVGPDEKQVVELKVRALYVDGKQKEFTLGMPHDVTDRLLVVRRAFRLNDTLPGEAASVPKWRWERGGWLMVDRVTGRVTTLNLPEFDAYYSAANWYRDYVAYCGVSDDGKKMYAMVMQLGRRKPILKKPLGDATDDDAPDSACPAPVWQRQPARVTFARDDEHNVTYSVRGHAVDVVNDSDSEEEASE
jgi:hypothetical protein